jgi:hypothetical protein
MNENEKPGRDNWQHRSKGMLCGTCMFFIEKVTNATQRSDHIIGRCRRRAPTMSGFPVVYSDDWCGDHKIDECKG